MNFKGQKRDVSEILRNFLRGGDHDRVELRGISISDAIQCSIRLGLDTRSLASLAVDALLPFERSMRIFNQTRRAALSRLIVIVAMCALGRRLFGETSDPSILDLGFFMIWLVIESVICSATFWDSAEAIDADGAAVDELIRGHLTLGHLTTMNSPMWSVLRRIRREEIATGYDGRDERARVFLEELRHKTDELGMYMEKSRFRFILAEIFTAIVSFVCFDGLVIMKWLDAGVDFGGF